MICKYFDDLVNLKMNVPIGDVHRNSLFLEDVYSDLNCGMKMEPHDIKNEQLILEDKTQYFYSIKPVHITMR